MPDEIERLQARLERERRARREAEAITERSARDSYDRERAVALLASVAEKANEAQELRPALAAALEAVCKYTAWPVGHAWLRDERDDDRLYPSAVWYQRDPATFAAFREATEAESLRTGEGLPGHVMAIGRPHWSEDVVHDPMFTRSVAAEASGLHGGFAFPVQSSGFVVAVLEFFTDAPAPPDEALLDLMSNVGRILGQVHERVHTRARLERLAAALSARNGELQRSNQELEAFAYAASHDLSEPLRMVTSYLRILQRRHASELDEEGLQLVTFAVAGMDRMRALIDALLDFSRAGRAPLTVRDVDARALVEVTLQALQARIEETGGRVVIEDLPTVNADAVQLGRVFQNLIANGLKFARPGVAPEVVVSAERNAATWRFVIADNGIGIDPRHFNRVFQMFHRLHSRDEYEGTGLGLALCERVIERHGGRIWVEPGRDGTGSRFCFTIPDQSPVSSNPR